MAWRSQALGPSVPRSLENLAQPHVDSFDYFLGEGLERVIEYLDGIEVSSRLPLRFVSASAAAVIHNFISFCIADSEPIHKAGLSILDRKRGDWASSQGRSGIVGNRPAPIPP
jgi:hypothetical protein